MHPLIKKSVSKHMYPCSILLSETSLVNGISEDWHFRSSCKVASRRVSCEKFDMKKLVVHYNDKFLIKSIMLQELLILLKIRKFHKLQSNVRLSKLRLESITTEKMELSMKDFLSKCDQIRSFLWIWSHLLKKSSMENFIFCAVFNDQAI